MRRLCLAAIVTLVACSGDAPSDDSAAASPPTSASDCTPNPTDPSRFVIVGFWNEDPTCSGEPIKTNAFPVDPTAGCTCWPGSSGSNSADAFRCHPEDDSFSYVQYNSLTCGEGDDTPTVKTASTDRCQQDIPPNLYAKIVDYSACR